MELILLKDVEQIGRKGEVIRVRDGFARNFLIPQRLALPSTRANQEFFQEQKIRVEKRQEKERQAAHAKAAEVEKIKLVIEAASGEKEKLFGSVTSEDIHLALAKSGHEIPKKHIHLKEAIRALGVHSVVVELYPQVKATIAVEVVKKA